jgi:hypothetical protein
MRENCYWYVTKKNNEEVVSALCQECGEKHKVGRFWNGSVLGYGDYDLNCDMCKKQIYLRNKNETEASNKKQ